MREGKGKGERRRRGERSLESPALPPELFSRKSFQRQRPWAPRARSGNAEYQAVVFWLPIGRTPETGDLWRQKDRSAPGTVLSIAPSTVPGTGSIPEDGEGEEKTEGLEERARESVRQQRCTSYNLLSSVRASQVAEWYSIFLLMQQTRVWSLGQEDPLEILKQHALLAFRSRSQCVCCLS